LIEKACNDTAFATAFYWYIYVECDEKGKDSKTETAG
jgi:hypothetical protein